MALDTYANFQAAIADHLIRTDLTSQIVDCITLFEAEAANELFRERRTQVGAILIPTTDATVATVSNAADNGSGLIRLTVDSTASLSTGQEWDVAEVGGTTEANDRWLITVINSTTVDLQGSVFTNTYTSGGIIKDFAGYCTLPTDYLGYVRVTQLGNPSVDLEYVSPSIFVSQVPISSSPASNVTSRIFTIEISSLRVNPTNSAHIELLYWAKNSAVSSSLNWLFSTRVDAYWNGVLEQIYRYTKDYDQASVYQQAKGAIFDQIKMRRIREPGAFAIRISGSNYGATP